MPSPASVAQVESQPRSQYTTSVEEMRALADQAAQLAQRAEDARQASIKALQALQAAQSAGAAMYDNQAGGVAGQQKAYVALSAPVPPVVSHSVRNSSPSYPQPVSQQTYPQPVEQAAYQPPVQRVAYQQPVQPAAYQQPVQQQIYQQPVQQQAYSQPTYQRVAYTPPAPARAPVQASGRSGYHAPLWQESAGS